MSDTTQPRQPAQALLNLIVTLLTPMFLAAAGNDLAFARQAATETLNAYRAETQSDLITIAKIIGFGLAALTALSLSMAEDLPLRTILRLHASASASDRSEHRNRQALTQTRPTNRPAPSEPDIDVAALTAAAAEMNGAPRKTSPSSPPSPKPAAKPPEPPKQAPANRRRSPLPRNLGRLRRRHRRRNRRRLPTLPPEERPSAAIWIDALNEVATDFLAGDVPPRVRPGELAALLASTGA